MRHVVVHSRDAERAAEIRRLLAGDEETLVRGLMPEEELLEVLLFQIPDLVVLAFDPATEDYVPFFETLAEDPFMSSIAFVVVASDVKRAIETYGRFGISSFVAEQELERELGRAARVLLAGIDPRQGAHVLKSLTALSGELVIPTDLFYAPYYAGFFSNYLSREGHISEGKKFALHLALTELLANAMEHGNAAITYQEKTEWLATNRSVQALVDERMARPPYAGRKVRLDYHIGPARSTFRIADEGDGFDTRKLAGSMPTGSLLEAHGRGVFMSRASVDRLAYNEKGNEVTIEVEHDGTPERTIPPGFLESPPKRYEKGDVVFREGEVSDRLYYVVNGRYDVRVNGQHILSAGPSDVFIGEMSFLVGNRRTATVVTSEAGHLVEISRELFTRAVKTYPSYAIFLSKLLARRLKESNERYAHLAPGALPGRP